jgi:DNA-binding beta-propeller fold protein YncE
VLTRSRIVSFLIVASVSAVAVTSAASGHAIHHRVTSSRVSGPFAGAPGFGSALVGFAPAGTGPGAVAIDPATHTLYVADGFSYSGNGPGGDTVSVIDARRCNAQDLSRCPGPWPTITLGGGTADVPSGIAIDVQNDTLYVSNIGAGTVSVINGATCNAMVSTGCGQTPVSVPVGDTPVGLFADPDNHTVYVPDAGDTSVSMIDSATCNAVDTGGCPSTPPPTVDVGASPSSAEANLATHTVYVSTIGIANGWAAFDADTCNATVQTGCGTQGTLIGDPSGPNDAVVDSANDTLYAANYDNTVSAFDLSHCNSADLAGCATEAAGVVTPFPDPGFSENTVWITLDAALHTVYAVYDRDDVLLAIDTDLCNGAHPAGCATLDPLTIHTGAAPQGVVLDSGTQTLYVADQFGNDVSVIDATRCNAQATLGCRHLPPAVALAAPGGVADDAAAQTAYATTASSGIALIDTRGCNAGSTDGCATTPPMVAAGDTPVAIAVSGRTHTIYVADYGSGATGAISVLDARACGAAHPAGCAVLHSLTVPGGHPDDLTLDPRTGTLYAATVAAGGRDLVTVFDAGTCNATNAGGCDRTPAALPLGESGDGSSALTIAANPRTDTLYATDLVTAGTGAWSGSTVYVIDAATCNATIMSGCQQAPARITVPAAESSGSLPVGVAVDPQTDTVYTADLDGGDLGTGSVGVIDGSTCNGHAHAGCGQTPITVPTQYGTEGVAVNPSTHEVYASNAEDSSVSVINGRACNAGDTRGCGRTPVTVPVGDYPGASLAEVAQDSNSSEPIAIDPISGTAYVQTIQGVSVIRGTDR